MAASLLLKLTLCGRHGKDWEMFGRVDVSAAPSALRAGPAFYVTEVRGPVGGTPVGLLESLIP